MWPMVRALGHLFFVLTVGSFPLGNCFIWNWLTHSTASLKAPEAVPGVVECNAGRVAVITGGSRGIGQAIAYRIAAHSAEEHSVPVTHIVCLSRTLASCAVTVDTINEQFPLPSVCTPQRASADTVDAGDSESIKAVVDRILSKFGRIDILVNNVGITEDKVFARMAPQEWTNVIRTNLNSVFYFTRPVVKSMMAKKWGRVVNIASVSGIGGNAGQTNYSAAKAGVIGFSKALAKEVAGANITVNAVSPGFVESDMTNGLSAAVKKAAVKGIPSCRFGRPDELAALVGFIVSDQASYITASNLVADGGVMFGMA